MITEKDLSAEVQKLRNFIEANIRATTKSGLDFIDPKKIKDEVLIKQNHVIFGRRGAGKSTLLKEFDSPDIWSVYINLEDYKDISFPNVLVSVLIEIFDKTLELFKTKINLWHRLLRIKKFKKEIAQILDKLKDLKAQPDEIETEIVATESTTAEISSGITANSIPLKTFFKGKLSTTDGKQAKSVRNQSKLNDLRLLITDIKKILNRYFEKFGISDNSLFILLDDFYFVKIENQPYLIDFIHRLTKDTNLFFKIGTIKHRTRLYIKEQTYIGVELRNDAIEVDLDYTLEDYDRIESFMKDILQYCIEKSGSSVSIEDMFIGEGFSQLCLASGGVPRDFLSIFVQVATKCIVSNNNKIGKIQVTEEAIANLSDKINALKRDTLNEEELFEALIFELRQMVFSEKKTNCFLVSKEQIESNELFRQIIRELFDLRLIHMIDKNTSAAPSDGKRYEAYLIDLSLYENSRPQHFKQIDPTFKDERSRKDDIRASVRLDPVAYLEGVVRTLDDMEEAT